MKEKGFPLIESLMFEDHDLIKRAATECMCNMVMCEEVRNLKVNADPLLCVTFAFRLYCSVPTAPACSQCHVCFSLLKIILRQSMPNQNTCVPGIHPRPLFSLTPIPQFKSWIALSTG